MVTANAMGYFRLGRLLCVFALVYFLVLSAKRHFHLRWKRFAHTDHETLHRNLPLCPEKAKQDFEPLDGLSLSHKTRTGMVDKGLMYPNAYCSITATRIKIEFE